MPTYRVLFVGLGKMGFHMASFLSKKENIDLYIYNRTNTVETKWKNKFSGIKYNFTKPEIKKGSCIFIHMTQNYKPTAGCIALQKKDFLILLKLINKKTKIQIN